MTPPDTAAVRLTGLHKTFGPVNAVAGVDLDIAPGEVVAFLGPNGAGKSTTIDMLLGLTAPDSGTATVFGRTPRQAVTGGLVGAMLQAGALLPDVTVGELVRAFAALHHRPMPVAEALERAGIADLAKRPTTKLSGGQVAAGPVRARAGARSRPARARRADRRDGRRGPPGVLGVDAGVHRRRPHRPVRHPLSGGGRRVRRPGRRTGRRPDRRRRHRRGDQVPGRPAAPLPPRSPARPLDDLRSAARCAVGRAGRRAVAAALLRLRRHPARAARGRTRKCTTSKSPQPARRTRSCRSSPSRSDPCREAVRDP